MTLSAPILPDVLAWLEARQTGIHQQQQQFEAASTRVSPETYSFGTVMHTAADAASLMANQWRAVWPRTRDFRTLPETIRTWGDDAKQAIAARWETE